MGVVVVPALASPEVGKLRTGPNQGKSALPALLRPSLLSGASPRFLSAPSPHLLRRSLNFTVSPALSRRRRAAVPRRGQISQRHTRPRRGHACRGGQARTPGPQQWERRRTNREYFNQGSSSNRLWPTSHGSAPAWVFLESSPSVPLSQGSQPSLPKRAAVPPHGLRPRVLGGAEITLPAVAVLKRAGPEAGKNPPDAPATGSPHLKPAPAAARFLGRAFLRSPTSGPAPGAVLVLPLSFSGVLGGIQAGLGNRSPDLARSKVDLG